jgi:hypothetical protein
VNKGGRDVCLSMHRTLNKIGLIEKRIRMIDWQTFALTHALTTTETKVV